MSITKLTEKEKNSKKGKKSNSKGKSYERELARKMSKLTGQTWRRTPYSGAGHIVGDIFRLPNPFPYAIEAKNRVDITLDRIFRNSNVIWDLVSDTQILIFNNRGQDLVVVPYKGTVNLGGCQIFAQLKFTEEYYYMISLEDFAKIIKEYEEDKSVSYCEHKKEDENVGKI